MKITVVTGTVLDRVAGAVSLTDQSGVLSRGVDCATFVGIATIFALGFVWAYICLVRERTRLEQLDRHARAVDARERTRDRDRRVVEEATEELQDIGRESYASEEWNVVNRMAFAAVFLTALGLTFWLWMNFNV